MKPTCRAIYEAEPVRIWKGASGLDGCYYTHIPEVSGFDLQDADTADVEVRLIKDISFDGRRVWQLGSVWFQGSPVMVIQNAGREGDDHAERFVTDWGRYRAMVGYLAARAKYGGVSTEEVDPDEERDDLLRFYGERLETVDLEYQRQQIERQIRVENAERQ